MNRILLIALTLTAFLMLSCSEPEIVKIPEPGFYVDQHKLLLPNLHGFVRAEKRLVGSREMFLLRRGEGYAWLNRMDGILLSRTPQDKLSEIWVLAQERIYNSSYLKATRITPGKFERISHPTRPYIEQILVVERTPELMAYMKDLDRQLYAKEIERLPEGAKIMLVNYYTPMGDSVYVFGFAAPPEDFLFWQDDAKKVFHDIEFNVQTRPAGY